MVVLLQNAYKKGILKEGFTSERWRAEFQNSRSGVRLNYLLGEFFESAFYANTTPLVGDSSVSSFPPDRDYVKARVELVQKMRSVERRILP